MALAKRANRVRRQCTAAAYSTYDLHALLGSVISRPTSLFRLGIFERSKRNVIDPDVFIEQSIGATFNSDADRVRCLSAPHPESFDVLKPFDVR